MATLQTNFEVLDSEVASGLKNIMDGYFKVSDTDETVLDLKENYQGRIEELQHTVVQHTMG